MSPIRFVTHGKQVQLIARHYGWKPGARYTNLRDIRELDFKNTGFLDIDWKNYNYLNHLSAAILTKPFMTVARDVTDARYLTKILREGDKLLEHSKHVVIVPKDPILSDRLESKIPKHFILGFSCPTKYGATPISPTSFKRPVHLLGGRPDLQRKYGNQMNVFSFDCNRFTLDAKFGDFFDGTRFKPLNGNSYRRCLSLSIKNINKLWEDYGQNDYVRR